MRACDEIRTKNPRKLSVNVLKVIVSLNPKSKCNWFDFARLTRTYFSTTRKALRCGLT